ncbi:L-serine ammonia-lyase, iron-sulfur-dependent subunit beta [Clostridium manihotivorum]|uniref:L-serine deaminase n=1 Tax=Clostridium manihotivorum TaxID=2320868 RepID=A0A410DZZ9_9CLOT|nr:L-serine ammonia-lyase, iron-sulfur-dependent subunit beta [Clostridium manihotivorum]QAA34628.1 L-serine ammonia-lyase, iron-sulfur-dependent, subunit beta [Clostridium manihotivorum]
MKKYGAFDIIGPIMIGPSSSHTAGAARLGKVAAAIAGDSIKEVTFLLHGSFSKTYKGHGTDRALVAGILGMEPSDVRLRESIEIAKEKGIKIEFKEKYLGDVHPNTVKFVIKDNQDNISEITGSSIGGGSIVITEVNGQEVNFTGEYPTVIISHRDVPGAVSKVSAILYNNNVNIAFMSVFRTKKGKTATMIFEVDSLLNEVVINEIKKVEAVDRVIKINPVRA